MLFEDVGVCDDDVVMFCEVLKCVLVGEKK